MAVEYRRIIATKLKKTPSKILMLANKFKNKVKHTDEMSLEVVHG